MYLMCVSNIITQHVLDLSGVQSYSESSCASKV